MLQKSSILQTAEFFFASPTGAHYLMDISRKTMLAHTSTKKNLKRLVRLGIIAENREKKGKRIFPVYQANLHNKLFKRYKRIYNLSSVLESGLIDFLEEKAMPRTIVLFGSYSTGEDTETSDIDLFIECPKEELSLKIFEKMLGRRIELHFKEKFALYQKELKNNIINGIVLNGF